MRQCTQLIRSDITVTIKVIDVVTDVFADAAVAVSVVGTLVRGMVSLVAVGVVVIAAVVVVVVAVAAIGVVVTVVSCPLFSFDRHETWPVHHRILQRSLWSTTYSVQRLYETEVVRTWLRAFEAFALSELTAAAAIARVISSSISIATVVLYPYLIPLKRLRRTEQFVGNAPVPYPCELLHEASVWRS